MNSNRIFKLGTLGALSMLALSGCGGGNSNPNPQMGQPGWNPNQQGWNQQFSQQPYQCQGNLIQLRNSVGQNQCYNTQNIAEACQISGGMLVNGNLCRKERQLPGRFRGAYRSNRNGYPDMVQLNLPLFPGESPKVYGKISSFDGRNVRWNAQLVQLNNVLGSASGDTGFESDLPNFSITGLSMTGNTMAGQPIAGQPMVQPGMQQPWMQPGMQQPWGQPWVQQPGMQPWGQPGVGVGAFVGAGIMPVMTQMQQLTLQLTYEGRIRIEGRASAISCEDGRGNSYPCQ